MRSRPALFVVALSACVLVPALASAVIDPAIKCQAAKLKLAGKYASCRLLADAAAVKNGTTADYSTCDTKIADGWAKVEASLGAECPTTGDLGDVQDSLVQCIPSKELVARIFMSTNAPTSGVQYFVNYNGATGGFEGTASGVECTNLVVGAIAVFNDHDDAGFCDMAFVNDTNLNGLVEVARCTFVNEGIADPDESDFVVGVTAAVNQNGDNVVAPDMSLVLQKPN